MRVEDAASGRSGRREASAREAMEILREWETLPRRPARPGLESPRSAIQRVVESVVEPLGGGDWRFARSGLRLSKREGVATARVVFRPIRYNVAGRLVGVWVELVGVDHSMAKWRRSLDASRQRDGLVIHRAIESIMRPRRALIFWDLIKAGSEEATAEDLRRLVVDVGMPYLEELLADLNGGAETLLRLRGRVRPEAFIEYLVRAGRRVEAGAYIKRLFEKPLVLEDGTVIDRRAPFDRRLAQYRREGLPTQGGYHTIAYLAAQFDIDVPE